MVNSLRVLRMFMLAMKSMFNFYPEQIKLSTKSHCTLSQYPPPPNFPSHHLHGAWRCLWWCTRRPSLYSCCVCVLCVFILFALAKKWKLVVHLSYCLGRWVSAPNSGQLLFPFPSNPYPNDFSSLSPRRGFWETSSSFQPLSTWLSSVLFMLHASLA